MAIWEGLRQPNPWLFGPLLVSAAVSIGWDLHIGLPDGGSQIGQWLIGSGLGCHFNRQFFRLFDEVPTHSGPGKCLPSGHAASAFMWLAVLPVLRGAARRRALFAVLTLGGLAGVVQVVRGAHFPSHILLAAAACAIVVLGATSVARPPAG